MRSSAQPEPAKVCVTRVLTCGSFASGVRGGRGCAGATGEQAVTTSSNSNPLERAANQAYSKPNRALRSAMNWNVSGGFEALGDFTGFDGQLERAFDVAEFFGRRDAEHGHQVVAEAGWERRLFGVDGGKLGDALGQAVDHVDAAALFFGALGGDVGARQAQQVVERRADFRARSAARRCRSICRRIARRAGGAAREILLRRAGFCSWLNSLPRRSSLSNMRAPTSAWPKKCTSPSGEMERVLTLPMSWKSAP